MVANERYDYVSRKALRAYARRFVNDNELRHPLASPIYADLRGLPPLLVQAGGSETLLDDGKRIAERARRAGVDVTLEIDDDMIHVWHAFAPLLPDADEAIARIGTWVRSALRT